jgi:hypothetical protein
MLGWLGDVKALWKKTRSEHNGSNHPWFELIERIRSRILPGGELPVLDEAMEQLGFEENNVAVEQDDKWETVSVNDNFEDVDEDPQNHQPERYSTS